MSLPGSELIISVSRSESWKTCPVFRRRRRRNGGVLNMEKHHFIPGYWFYYRDPYYSGFNYNFHGGFQQKGTIPKGNASSSSHWNFQGMLY